MKNGLWPTPDYQVGQNKLNLRLIRRSWRELEYGGGRELELEHERGRAGLR